MKVALVSPLPPSVSGIADYTIDVAQALRGRHEVELFCDQAETSTSAFTALPISELGVRPHDAVIYQMGNGPAHDFMYEWIERIPGIVVLHDLVLHHSFARRFLESAEARAYAGDPSDAGKRRRAEEQHARYEAAIESVYPGEGARLAAAYLNSSGDLLPYAFPLFEPVLSKALAVGVHNSFMIDAVRSKLPGAVSYTHLTLPTILRV